MKYSVLAFYGLIILLGFLSYYLVAPFLSYIIMGLLFGFIFYPLYKFFEKRMPPVLSATLVLILTLVVIVLPALYMGGTIISQATTSYQEIQARGIPIFDEMAVSEYISQWLGLDVSAEIADLFDSVRNTLRKAVPSIITGAGTFLVGLFVMFFVMFFSLKDGHKWFEGGVKALPLKPKQRKRLADDLTQGTKALLYGHIVTSVIIGILVGGVFFAVGLQNAIFWAFVMIILGIIPFLGAPMIYIPAGIIMISQGGWIGGLVILILGSGIQIVVDYIIRPRMVSARSTIHPVFVIVGVFGGLVTMGIVGFLIGPLILSIFVTLLKYQSE